MGRPRKIKTVVEEDNNEIIDSNVVTLDSEVEENKEQEIIEVIEPQSDIKLASQLNESKVGVVERMYDVLFTTGSLLSLNISRWGMSTRLKESDLEIEKVPDIIHLGKKMLIQPSIFNQFAQVEQRARTYLKRVSREFPFAKAYFVAASNIKDTRAQLNTFKEEYDILTRSFIENYETNKEEVLVAYPTYAEELRKSYPAVADLPSKFKFKFGEFRISMPNALEEVNVGLLIAEEQEVARLTADTKARLEENANAQLAEITDFVSTSIKDLREDVDSVFAIIINKINKGEVVSDTNKNTLARKIQDFGKLNIFGDKALAERIEAVKAFLAENRDLKDKENGEDREALKTFLLEAKTVAQNTTDISSLTGEYFRALEI